MRAHGEFIALTPVATDTKNEKGLILDGKSLRYRRGIIELSACADFAKGDEVIYDSANTHNTMINNVKYLITKVSQIAIVL